MRVLVCSLLTLSCFGASLSPSRNLRVLPFEARGREYVSHGAGVDGNGNAYITGFTSSPDFPTTSGAFQTKLNSTQDVFVAKLSPDGSQLIYSTLLGSSELFFKRSLTFCTWSR